MKTTLVWNPAYRAMKEKEKVRETIRTVVELGSFFTTGAFSPTEAATHSRLTAGCSHTKHHVYKAEEYEDNYVLVPNVM